MLRSALVVTAAALFGACAANSSINSGGSKAKPGVEPLLPISTYLDSTALHQALLNAPPIPPQVTRRTLYLVEFDTLGAVYGITALYRRTGPEEYVQTMARMLRAHVKPQPPRRKPQSLIFWLTSGPAASIRRVSDLVERPPSLRNPARITTELERSAHTVLGMNPGLAGQERTGVLSIRVDTAGVPTQTHVYRSAGDLLLDRELIRVAALMRFTPAAIEGLPVPVWVQIPVSASFPGRGGENSRNP